jgi:hypothetical protein
VNVCNAVSQSEFVARVEAGDPRDGGEGDGGRKLHVGRALDESGEKRLDALSGILASAAATN